MEVDLLKQGLCGLLRLLPSAQQKYEGNSVEPKMIVRMPALMPCPISRSDTHTYVELRFTIRCALRTIWLHGEVDELMFGCIGGCDGFNAG